MKWRLAVGAIAALLVGAFWRGEEAPAPSVPVPLSLTGTAPLTFAPPAAGGVGESPEAAGLAQVPDRPSLGDAPALAPLGTDATPAGAPPTSPQASARGR
jgi:hypothetical protein